MDLKQLNYNERKKVIIMTQYINKDALLAEIVKRIQVSQDYAKLHLTENARIGNQAQQLELNDILSFINTLKVKEVDFEKEVDNEWNKCDPVNEGMGCEFATIGIEQFYFITKYFFELGLNTQKEKLDWSEEDKMMLECVLDKIGDLGTGEMCKDWLKSIKERYTWKPTDEQLEALEWSLSDYRNVIFEERHDTLVSLYNNLKKLKGE